jgi:hypothetical protein
MAKTQSRIGESPLDALVPAQEAPKTAGKGKRPSGARKAVGRTGKATTATPEKVQKVRLTVHVPEDVASRAKDAVFWTPGLTLASLAEAALSRAVNDLEKKRKEPFPPRTSDLKGGRPLK